MPHTHLSILLLIFWGAFVQAQKTTSLYLIEQNNRLGYINKNGNVVIKPRFRNAGDFENGLAPAQENGYWGYINTKGKFVIKPQYEYATSFDDGLALVVKDSMIFRINTKGEIPKDLLFYKVKAPSPRLNPYEPPPFPVLNQYKILQQGDSYILEDGGLSPVAVVARYNKKNRETEYGVINQLDSFITPLGVYEHIFPFKNGLAEVSIGSPSNKYRGYKGFINTEGALVFEYKPSEKYGELKSSFSDSIAIIQLKKYWTKVSVVNMQYPGYINYAGEIILNDTLVDQLTPFSEGRAFIHYYKDPWGYFLVNSSIKTVTPKRFSKILFDGKFKNGLAFASTGGKYGLINTSGDFVVEEKFIEIHPLGIVDDYFFFREIVNLENNTRKSQYGVSDINGNILIPPCFDNFDPKGFRDGVLRVWIDDKAAYLNRKGQIIWQQKNSSLVELLNIDFALNNGFYASKRYEEEVPGASPKDIAFLQHIGCVADSVSLRIDTGKIDTIAGKWLGHKVYLANLTKNILEFNTEDGLLKMEIQALKPNGEWTSIHIITHSWCGNSYFPVKMAAQDFWEFDTPIFDGVYKTKFRMVAEYRNPSYNWKNHNEEAIIEVISNEFDGGVNPGQFWRKTMRYTPDMGLMGINK